MKNIILAILFVFSVVWSQNASARQVKHKKKPSVSQKHSAKKSKGESAGYRSSYLRKKHNRSVASVSKKAKKAPPKKSKKKRKH